MFSFFEKLVDPFPPAPPSQPPKGVYAFCRHYTQGIERYLIWMAITTAILAVAEAMLYGILGQLVDWLASKERADFLAQEWPTLLAMSIFLLVFIPAVVIINSMLVHQTLMGNFPMLVRWQAHRYLLGQSYGFFQNEFSGRVATKVMQTALAVRESVMKVLDVMLFISVYLVTTIILVASADWRLCLPLLLWLVAYTVVLRYFVPRLQSISMRQADARALMTGRIVDSYTNILTLKLFSHNEREADYVQHGMNEFLQTVHPQMRLVTWLNIYVWGLNMLLVFATAATGIFLWMQGSITPGAIAIAMSIAVRISGMSHWVMWEISNLFENIGTVQDGINTVSNKQSVTDDNGAQPLQVSQGAIDFRHIRFSYGGQRSVFDGLDLRIQPGEKVGIVGRSGAGKSTLVNLMMRFYDLDSGAICIDGTDLRGVTQESLRASIAMVSQDTSLLFRSVRENIIFGRPDATEEQLINAAKRAHADEFIQQLQDAEGRRGYDAHVGERGVSLSGGQRQRIAIARVLLKDAPILVLDEATSALDSEVEAGIQQSLYDLMEGKTVLAIAHRLSTIAAMDRLIVLDHGRIVEQGSHAELIANNALYAQLWAHQSGGFLGLR
ncbi:ABC transporter ATP-binding protein [Oceanicoccus sagamiensis]|uniref:Multidrug ABC transporter ATP-binding protein n=1 Tax=Oceanicoccus sagamiensis TaxID=716816 RepID=A0A1X9N8I6_9GAMM|nr:ABC transporter ATP-binding protein [Oceanicoccus sagamiensis]ARN73481.1 multidrug ABC transporter ATP-binding protein [Oceanicoccus sagamiensis]